MTSTPTYHLVLQRDGRVWAVGPANTDAARRFGKLECWGIEQEHVGPIYDALERQDHAVFSIARQAGPHPDLGYTVYRNLAGVTFGAGEEDRLLGHRDTEEIAVIKVTDVATAFTLQVEKLEECALGDPDDYGQPYMESLMQEVLLAGMVLETRLGCFNGRREAFNEIDRVLNGTAWRRRGETVIQTSDSEVAA